MSGHSKWSQIKRQKGVADTRRGQMFTKISYAITIAVKEGSGVTDPEKNFRLRLAIEKARAVNMPKENVDRAISRAKGLAAGDLVEEIVYEGFGPGGVSVLAEAVTDNKQRTASDIKQIFEKNGGTLATPGAVSYMFETKGLITIRKSGNAFESIFTQAVDAGAEDVEEAGNEVLLYTRPDELTKVRDKISAVFSASTSVELTRTPKTIIPITSKQQADQVLSLVGKLEDLDDVQKVYANFDIPDKLLAT